ncbi:MAG: transglutaminase domain-containing protein [Bacteroidota bacterium]
MKFIKRFLFTLLFIGLVVFGYAHYKGIPLSSAQELIVSLKSDLGEVVKNITESDQVTDNAETPSEETNVEKVERPEDKPVKQIKIPANPFRTVDRHARSCPDSLAVSISLLANYLQRGRSTDIEKVRAIFVWLTENVAYDDAGFNSGNYSGTSAEEVLANRESVCEGYSNLYLALGQQMGLEIKKISGYAKGYGYQEGDQFSRTNHAWNAVKIQGNWRISDATWGTGSGENQGGKLVSKKAFDEYWFNVDPYEAIFNHFPEDQSLGFVTPMITKAAYQQMPYISSDFFKIFSGGRQIYEASRNKEITKYPKSFQSDIYLKAVNLSLDGELQVGKNYTFIFHAPEAKSMAIIDSDNNWTYFEGVGGEFMLNYSPSSLGEISIGYQKEGRSQFDIFLKYEVVDTSAI